MGYLNLRLKEPLITYRVGTPPMAWSGEGWQLRWEVSLDGWDEVTLSNGLKLTNMPGNLILRVGTPKEPKADEGEKPLWEQSGPAIGALHFISAYEGSSDGVVRPSPDGYSVECVVSADELRTLIDKVQGGSGPIFVKVAVPGLDPGGLPDFSYQTWDIAERSWRAVDGLAFSFYPGGEPRRGIETEEALEPTEPPRPSDEAIAVRELTGLIRWGGTWVVALLAAIVVALLIDG